MARPNRSPEIESALTRVATTHPPRLADVVAARSGLFVVSRVFDGVRTASRRSTIDGDANDDAPGATRVDRATATDSTRTAKDVIDQYSSGPDDDSFAKTVVSVRLVRVGDENLVSRSQAKRLLQRVDRFRCVVLDFAEVTGIGQAFADEIFRVFTNAHPEVELTAVHAVPEVQQMIRRAEVLRDEQGGQLPLPT